MNNGHCHETDLANCKYSFAITEIQHCHDLSTDIRHSMSLGMMTETGKQDLNDTKHTHSIENKFISTK